MNRATFFEIIRFGGVGAFVAVMHLILVFVLTDIVGIWYLYASSISYTFAIIINFVLQNFFVWQNAKQTSVKKQFQYFVLLALVSLGLNTTGMYTLVHFFDWNYMFTQIFMIVILSIGIFLINRRYIFV